MRSLLTILALAFTLFLPGCDGGGGPTEPQETAAGTYALELFNGSPLPALRYQFPNSRYEFTAATLVLRSDSTYTETIDGRLVRDDGTGFTDQTGERGVYTITGSTITFVVSSRPGYPGYVYTGVLIGRDLTYTIGHNFVMKYKKQSALE